MTSKSSMKAPVASVPLFLNPMPLPLDPLPPYIILLKVTLLKVPPPSCWIAASPVSSPALTNISLALKVLFPKLSLNRIALAVEDEPMVV